MIVVVTYAVHGIYLYTHIVHRIVVIPYRHPGKRALEFNGPIKCFYWIFRFVCLLCRSAYGILSQGFVDRKLLLQHSVNNIQTSTRQYNVTILSIDYRQPQSLPQNGTYSVPM